MMDIKWKSPEADDVARIATMNNTKNMGSDCSAVNIYLLRNKYDIKISFYKGFLLRKYSGEAGRRGFGFPIGDGNAEDVINVLKQDAQSRNEKMEFCLLDRYQKDFLEKYQPDKYYFITDRANSDYIYKCEDLCRLTGKKYHKKKNHCLKFAREYKNCHFEILDSDNINDAYNVALEWYNEKSENHDSSKRFELEEICECVKYYDKLNINGGVLYADGKAVAMTIASAINSNICDIHFEKAIGEYAGNGGYAFINREFALNLNGFTYINREEDIGVEGLRKAKMSYHPYNIFHKYSAVEKDYCL